MYYINLFYYLKFVNYFILILNGINKFLISAQIYDLYVNFQTLLNRIIAKYFNYVNNIINFDGEFIKVNLRSFFSKNNLKHLIFNLQIFNLLIA